MRVRHRLLPYLLRAGHDRELLAQSAKKDNTASVVSDRLPSAVDK
jgi:hypothetical protein